MPKPVRKDALGNVLPTGIQFRDSQRLYTVGVRKQSTLKWFKTLEAAKAYHHQDQITSLFTHVNSTLVRFLSTRFRIPHVHEQTHDKSLTVDAVG